MKRFVIVIALLVLTACGTEPDDPANVVFQGWVDMNPGFRGTFQNEGGSDANAVTAVIGCPLSGPRIRVASNLAPGEKATYLASDCHPSCSQDNVTICGTPPQVSNMRWDD